MIELGGIFFGVLPCSEWLVDDMEHSSQQEPDPKIHGLGFLAIFFLPKFPYFRPIPGFRPKISGPSHAPPWHHISSIRNKFHIKLKNILYWLI